MKKLLCVFFTVCLLCGFCYATAAQTFPNAVALLQYWEENGYPEDVGSIYSTDGTADNLTIQLVGDTDGSRAEELRAMIIDQSTVTFEEGRFTEKDLQAINQNIQDELMPADSGIQSCGVGWGKDGGFGISGNELRVVVQVDEARVEEYAKTLGMRYGEAVVVEASAGKPELTDTEASAEDTAQEPAEDTEPEPEAAPATRNAKTDGLVIGITFATIAVLAVLAVLAMRFRRRKK